MNIGEMPIGENELNILGVPDATIARLLELMNMGVPASAVKEGLLILHLVYGGFDGWSFFTDAEESPLPLLMEHPEHARIIEIQ